MILCLIYLQKNLPETKHRDIGDIISDLKIGRISTKNDNYEMAHSVPNFEDKVKRLNKEAEQDLPQ